jgi:hypothetical protein
VNEAKWDRRIRRANELASSYPFSAEGLRYYARIATFQKGVYGEIQKALADSPRISSDRPLRDELDFFLLLPKFPGFLSVIQKIAPAPLAQAAATLAMKGSAAWQHAIEDFWYRDSDLAAGADDAEQPSPRSVRCNLFRSRARVDFSPAVRRISSGSPRSRDCGRNSIDLPALRRQACRRRIAE